LDDDNDGIDGNDGNNGNDENDDNDDNDTDDYFAKNLDLTFFFAAFCIPFFFLKNPRSQVLRT